MQGHGLFEQFGRLPKRSRSVQGAGARPARAGVQQQRQVLQRPGQAVAVERHVRKLNHQLTQDAHRPAVRLLRLRAPAGELEHVADVEERDAQVPPVFGFVRELGGQLRLDRGRPVVCLLRLPEATGLAEEDALAKVDFAQGLPVGTGAGELGDECGVQLLGPLPGGLGFGPLSDPFADRAYPQMGVRHPGPLLLLLPRVRGELLVGADRHGQVLLLRQRQGRLHGEPVADQFRRHGVQRRPCLLLTPPGRVESGLLLPPLPVSFDQGDGERDHGHHQQEDERRAGGESAAIPPHEFPHPIAGRRRARRHRLVREVPPDVRRQRLGRLVPPAALLFQTLHHDPVQLPGQ